jgi:hypothetical protein
VPELAGAGSLNGADALLARIDAEFGRARVRPAHAADALIEKAATPEDREALERARRCVAPT